MSANINRLWAPWRAHFITKQPAKRCIFCHALREKKDKKHLVIHRGRLVFALLNLYPYNNGHVMIAPQRHIGDLLKLKPEELAELFAVVQRLLKQMKRALRAQGFNVGMNLGSSAGAGIPGHLHLHVVPRWKGDTNFMPVLTGTKVISQALAEVYRLLADNTTRNGHRR